MTSAILVVQTLAILLLTIFVLSLLKVYAELSSTVRRLANNDSHLGTQPLSPLVPRPRDELSAAEDIVGTDVEGRVLKIGINGRDERTLIAFLSTGCLTCKTFWEAIGDRENRSRFGGRILVVTRGEEAESPSSVRKLTPAGVQSVMSTSAWESYDVPGSPYFVHVDGSNRQVIGAGSATSWDQVLSLMEQAKEDGGEVARRTALASQLGDDDAALIESGLLPDDPSLWAPTPPVGGAS
jgi:hypothetical protein